MTVNAGAGQEGGTPFTQVGVRELRRLGILTMVIPTGCAVGAEVVQGILTGFMNVSVDGWMQLLLVKNTRNLRDQR